MYRVLLLSCACAAHAVVFELPEQNRQAPTRSHQAPNSNSVLDRTHNNHPFVFNKHLPHFHVWTHDGWLNDPAAFVHYKNKYHVFYQYYPLDQEYGMHWGHAASTNLVDWQPYPPALAPKGIFEKLGCLAGSAIVYNKYLTVFYTGDYHTKNVTIHSQNVAISTDGVNFQRFLHNPIVKLQSSSYRDFKHPKVWRMRNAWYMLVGASTRDDRGCLVLYTADDIFNWRLSGTVAESLGDMGYLWDNPDFFQLDGMDILMLSVHGIKSDGYRYKNTYTTGYVVGRFNYDKGKFEDTEISTATFNEVDYGHDFHGARTARAPDGRLLLVAWLGSWDTQMSHKSRWTSFLTLVRELSLNSRGRILMNPARETSALRVELLEDAWYRPGEGFSAGAHVFELLVNASRVHTSVVVSLEWDGSKERFFTIKYLSRFGYVMIDRGGCDGVRKAYWVPDGELKWRIIVDSSSVEVFCGEGEVVFTSRIYPRKAMRVRVDGDSPVHLVQYKLRRSLEDVRSRFRKPKKSRVVGQRKPGAFTKPRNTELSLAHSRHQCQR